MSYLFPQPLTIQAIADKLAIKLADQDKTKIIVGFDAITAAGSDDITFANNSIKAQRKLADSNCGACLLTATMAPFAPASCIALVVDNPEAAFEQLVAITPATPATPATRATLAQNHVVPYQQQTTAVIGNNCNIATDVQLGIGVVIGNNVSIGAGSTILHYSWLDDDVIIGDNCLIGSHTSIKNAEIANHVAIGNGTRIGEAGFGIYVNPDGLMQLKTHFAKVKIASHVNIGANCVIDRGVFTDTAIDNNTLLDKLVMISHNVKIGKRCVIVSQSGIAGSVDVGDDVQFGGQVGVADHVSIGSASRITAQSGVTKSLPGNDIYSGTPARSRKQYLRSMAKLMRN